MNPLQQDFDRLRCAGTPWCLILTPDYRECQRALCKMLVHGDDPPSLWAWDCLQGHRCLSELSLTSILGSPDDTVQAPALLLKKALDLPENSVLFFIVPKQEMVEDAAVIQGLANLRNEFKANRRTLVLLARDIKLPSLLSEDVPVLDDPLPNDSEIKGVIDGLVKEFRSLDGFRRLSRSHRPGRRSVPGIDSLRHGRSGVSQSDQARHRPQGPGQHPAPHHREGD